jgi:hypothetical protein
MMKEWQDPILIHSWGWVGIFLKAQKIEFRSANNFILKRKRKP